MWQHISFTLSATLDTYNRIHKNWAKFGTSYASIFLMLGFIIGFTVLFALGFLLQPAWVELNNTDQYFYVWFENAMRLDFRILVMSTGLLGAYLHRNPEGGQQPFAVFSRSIPRAAWQLFILLAVVQSAVYYIHLNGSMRNYAYSNEISYEPDHLGPYLTWLY